MIDRKLFFSLKKYGYLAIFIIALLPVFSFWLMKTSGYPNLFAYFTVFFVFILVPFIDYFIGIDAYNPHEKMEVPRFERENFYRIVTILCVPAFFALLVFSLWVFTTFELNLVGKIGWILSIGVFSSVFGINSSHELMHKTNKIEPFFSGLLLSWVCFCGFKIEHIRGHHVHVSTPKDHSSAKFDQSLYSYLIQALSHNYLEAFRLEARRLKKKGLSPWNYRNELIWWQLLTAFWIFCSWYFFGLAGLIFFLAQSFIAIVFLEIINYVEHYGLERKILKNGKYEPVSHKHSWNSSFLFTNLLLFQLQRHSDHHAYPKRRYQVLRHFDDSPQLPFGYATMIVVAIFPPLWRAIMNERVKKYLSVNT